jgi:hypothetical protein
MKRGPISYRKKNWTPEQRARWRQIERDFHVRVFGEELARVNLDLTIPERRRYIAWMNEVARKNGVPPPKGPFDHLETLPLDQF